MAYFYCQQCDARFPMHQQKPRWDGLLVCQLCWDPQPDRMSTEPIYMDGQAVPNAIQRDETIVPTVVLTPSPLMERYDEE